MDSNDWKREEDYERLYETYKSEAKDQMVRRLKEIEKSYEDLIDKKTGFIGKERKGLALEYIKQAWSLGYYYFETPEEEPIDILEYEFDDYIDEYLNENLYPILLGDEISNKALVIQNLLGDMYGQTKRSD
jgi:hypothetical protein